MGLKKIYKNGIEDIYRNGKLMQLLKVVINLKGNFEINKLEINWDVPF